MTIERLLMEVFMGLMSYRASPSVDRSMLWFKKLCKRFMVKTLQLENGVKVLIEYVVGDDKDSTLTGEKAEDVSNVLLTPGLGTAGGNDKELTEYFTNIVNQLLNLAEESDDNSGRIAVSVLEALAVRFPNYFKAFVYEKTTNELVKWGLNKVPNKQGVVSTVEEKNSADPIRIALGVEHKITTFKKPLIQEVISQDAIANSVNRELADRLKGKVWVYDGDGSGEDGAFENSVLVTGESITRIINLLKKFTDKTICCEQAMELLITPILESLMYLYSFGFNAVNQLKSLSQGVETIKKAQKDKNGAVGVVIERVEALLVDLRCIFNGYFKAKYGSEGREMIEIVTNNRMTGTEVYPLFILNFGVEAKYVEIEVRYPTKLPSIPIENFEAVTEHDMDSFDEELWQSRLDTLAIIDIFRHLENKEFLPQLFIGMLYEYIAIYDDLTVEQGRSDAEKDGNHIRYETDLSVNPSQLNKNRMGIFSREVRMTMIGRMVLEFIEYLGPEILTNRTSNVLAFINTVLVRAIENPPKLSTLVSVNGNVEDENIKSRLESQVSDSEILILALSLLLLIVGDVYRAPGGDSYDDDDDNDGDNDGSDKEKDDRLIRAAFSHLETLKIRWSEYPVIAQLINEIMQLNPNISSSQLESTTDSNGKTMLSSSNSEYIMAIRDLQSPMIPIQAYGLVTLQNLVLEKIKTDKAGNTGKNGSNGGKDNVSDDGIVETSIDVFKKLIEHEDSYIYLKSISALVRILTVSDKVHKKMILRQIADGYFTEEAAIDDENSNNDGFDARLRYGEVLIQFCKNVGSAVILYVDEIVPKLIQDIDKHSRQKMQLQDRQLLFLHSSISILGNICAIYPLALTRYLGTVVEYCKNSILMSFSSGNSGGGSGGSGDDSNGADEELAPLFMIINRSCITLLSSIILGFKDNLLKQIDASLLREIYRCLKLVSNSIDIFDDVSIWNANVGLNELNKVIKNDLFNSFSLLM